MGVLLGGRGTQLVVGAALLVVVLLPLLATVLAAVLAVWVLLLEEPIMGGGPGLGPMELVLGPIMLVGGP